MKFHHLAVAVRDMEACDITVRALGGFHLQGPVKDEAQKAVLSLYDMGGIVLELVGGDVAKAIIGGRNYHIYHVCYEVPMVEEAIEEMKENGWRLLSEPTAAPLFRGKRVCFLVHPDFHMIELIEG